MNRLIISFLIGKTKDELVAEDGSTAGLRDQDLVGIIVNLTDMITFWAKA